jgi:hypothetical protein
MTLHIIDSWSSNEVFLCPHAPQGIKWHRIEQLLHYSNLFESQDLSQVFDLIGYNDSIKDWIMLVLHIDLINPLRICHWFALGHDY